MKLARDLEGLIKPLAKANERARKGNQPGASSPKLAKLSPIDTRKESANLAGVGERTYDAGKLILDAAESGEITAAVALSVHPRGRSPR